MNTEQVAKRLVELCREGKGQQAQDELYSNDAVSVEMEGMQAPGMPTVAKGMDAIREKGRQFNAGIEERHGGTVGDPIVVGNWFAVTMTLDATMKGRGRGIVALPGSRNDSPSISYDLRSSSPTV